MTVDDRTENQLSDSALSEEIRKIQITSLQHLANYAQLLADAAKGQGAHHEAIVPAMTSALVGLASSMTVTNYDTSTEAQKDNLREKFLKLAGANFDKSLENMKAFLEQMQSVTQAPRAQA